MQNHTVVTREIVERLAGWEIILVREGIPFKRRNNGDLVTFCVFHKERTPSLHFWEKKKRFKCYGCRKDGDILAFIAMRHKQIRESVFVAKYLHEVELLARTDHSAGVHIH